MRLNQRRFSQKICLLNPTPFYKPLVNQLLDIVKATRPDGRVFGVGGPPEPFFKSFGNPEALDPRPFNPLINGDSDFRFYLNLPMIKNNLENYSFLRQIAKEGFWMQFTEDLQSTGMCLSFGNELLSARVYERVDEIYKQAGRVRPLTVHVDRSIIKANYEKTENLDFFIYTVPVALRPKVVFNFPSKFIGKQTLFDSWSHLLSLSPKYSTLANESLIYLNKDLSKLIFEEIIHDQNHLTRERYRIPDNSTVIFIYPGSSAKEVDSNLMASLDGMEKFVELFTKDNRYTKANFCVVVNLSNEQDDKPIYRERLNRLGIQSVFIYGESERRSLLCCTDLALCSNDDTCFEMAAYQVPFLVLDNSSFLRSYIELLYNVHVNDINLSANGPVFPELTGWQFGAKIAEFLGEWFVKPKKKFRIADRAYNHLYKFLPAPSAGPFEKQLQVKNTLFEGFGSPRKEFEACLGQLFSLSERIGNRKDLVGKTGQYNRLTQMLKI